MSSGESTIVVVGPKRQLHSHPSATVAKYTSFQERPETWGVWFGRKVVELGCDCLLPCVKCCCCCCAEVLSPQQQIEKEFERLTVSSEQATGYHSALVAKAIQLNPARYVVLDAFQVFSPARDFVYKLNLSGINLETDVISGMPLASRPCLKIENICKFFPQLTELNLSKCNIGTRTYQIQLPDMSCTACCLKAISTLQNLGKLDLSYNPISETALIESIPKLPNLRILNLTGCAVSAETKEALTFSRDGTRTVLRIIDKEKKQEEEKKA